MPGPADGQTWPEYNIEVLGKTEVIWRTDTQAISQCSPCQELLVWFDLTQEALTFRLDPSLLADFEASVTPMIRAFHDATIDTLRDAYDSIITALAAFVERHEANRV